MKHIIVIQKDRQVETYGSLTGACKAHKDFQYHSIKMLSFPFEHKGWVFHKTDHNIKIVK